MSFGKSSLDVHDLFENLTAAAKIHLFFPFFMGNTGAIGAIDKPTFLSGFEFPGWTCLFNTRLAFVDLPAVFRFFQVRINPG